MSGMQQLFRTFFTALVLALSMTMLAAQQDDMVRKWITLSSQQLIDTAWHHTHGHNVTDTTLICLSMVVSRYDSDLPKQETEQCIQASMYLWSIYFYLYFDYSKSMEYLIKAQTMAQAASLHIPKIDNAFGALYQTLAEQCHDRSLHVRALHYYTQAFQEALRQQLDEETDNSFGNAIYVAAAIDSMEAVNSQWDSYQRLPVSEKNVLRDYNRLMYNGLRLMAERKFEDAFMTFGQQFDRLPDTENYVRHQYVTLTHCAKALEAMGRRQEAVDFLLRAEQKALQSGMKDMQLEVYERMAGCYEQLGNTVLSRQLREKYMSLRDSLVNYRQLAGLSEMQFMGRLSQLNEEMEQVRESRDHLGTLLTLVVVIAFFLLVVFLILQHNNRKLRRTNASLYQKNVEMLKAEEEKRQLERQLHSAKPQEEKYKNSNLDELTKNELMERILSIMESGGEIFSPDFSVERLATLTDSKYKYVSQVIHEKWGENFNSFLNSYRIKEACRRLGDIDHYGQLTIEAIASGVGFRSRTSFVTSFKRITGLTPSEYQRLAREEASAAQPG